jgi:hypothetical protein
VSGERAKDSAERRLAYTAAWSLAEQVLPARRPAHVNFDTSVLLVGHAVTGRHGRIRFSVGSGGNRRCRNACGDQGRRDGIRALPRQRLVEGWRTRGIRVASQCYACATPALIVGGGLLDLAQFRVWQGRTAWGEEHPEIRCRRRCRWRWLIARCQQQCCGSSERQRATKHVFFSPSSDTSIAHRPAIVM